MARVVLRLSDAEFYDLTPRQFHYLLDQHDIGVRYNELLFGQLTAAVVNGGFTRPKDSVAPREYMPSYWGVEPPRPRKKRTDTKAHHKQLALQVRALFANKAVIVAAPAES